MFRTMSMHIVINLNGTYSKKKTKNRLIRYCWLTMCSCSVVNSIVGSFCNFLKILNCILWTTIWSKDYNADRIFGCWKTQYQISWMENFFVCIEIVVDKSKGKEENMPLFVVSHRAFLLWASMKIFECLTFITFPHIYYLLICETI